LGHFNKHFKKSNTTGEQRGKDEKAVSQGTQIHIGVNAPRV